MIGSVHNGEFLYLVIAQAEGDFPVPARTLIMAAYADSDAALMCAQKVMGKQDPNNPLAWKSVKVSPMRLGEAPLELLQP